MLFLGLSKTIRETKQNSILPPLLGLEVVPRLPWRSLVCHTPCEFRSFSHFHLLKVTRMRKDTSPNQRFCAITTDHRTGNLERQSSISPSWSRKEERADTMRGPGHLRSVALPITVMEPSGGKSESSRNQVGRLDPWGRKKNPSVDRVFKNTSHAFAKPRLLLLQK